MQLLTEIFRTEGTPREGRTIFREAVRGIILNGRDVFMIHSPVNGDYKFPGGGVQPGETHDQALRREIMEESGRSIAGVHGEFGMITEYDIPKEPDYDVFKMTSYYYLCCLDGSFSSQNLDDYERDLAFQPVWVDIDHAIQTNKSVLAAEGEKPLWTRRETFTLGLLKNTTRPVKRGDLNGRTV